MKNFLKILTLISLLYFIPIICMEEGDESIIAEIQKHQPIPVLGGLPCELWAPILYFVYFDSDALEGCKTTDIYEALDYLKIKFLPSCSQNMRLICKTCDYMNSELNKNLLKEELKKFYRPLLTKKFLKFYDGGLYPKDGMWFIGCDEIDKGIALFLVTGNQGNEKRLFDYIIIKAGENNLGNIENVISLLLFYDFCVDAKDSNGTVLHTALYMHDRYSMKKVIKILLTHGVNVNVLDQKDRTGLHFAMKWRRMPLRDSCPDYHKIDMKEIVKMLVTYGVNVNSKTIKGQTALHYSVVRHLGPYDMKEVIELLLANGADVNISDNDGKTAMAIAEERQLIDVVKLMEDSESYKRVA